MGEFINNNSVWIVAALILGVAGLFAWDHRRSWRALAVIGAVLVVLTAGYWTSRQGPSDVATVQEVAAVLEQGVPVVLEVYSDSCTVCLVSKRSVDAMEERLEGRATVLRINIDEQVGRDVARRYGVGLTPTFIVFGSDGYERHRDSGFPDTGRLEAEALRSG